MDIEETGARLRAFKGVADISPTCRKLCDAFELIDNLESFQEVSLGAVYLGQRVTVVTGGSNASCDGNIKSADIKNGTLSVVLDSGVTLPAVSDKDVIGLIKEKDVRLDFVSRILWSQALTEGRLPLSGSHLLPAYCPWEMCEHAFHLTEMWTEALWSSPPFLTDIGFESWLYLFAESIRMKAKGSVMLGLRIIEESWKHLVAAEENKSSAIHRAFVIGVGDFVKYWPASALALGNISPGGANGAFSILRHMVSTQAVKILRAIFRKPRQTDMGKELIAEDELRSRFSVSNSSVSECLASASLFGDGQSHWNTAWLCSLASDASGVCRALRKAIEITDSCSDSDFVAAKSRWDLAGYLTLGGEGNTYDMRIISKLAQEAEKLSETLDVLGMKFFVDGESICASLVKAVVSQYSGKGPHIVPAQRLGGSLTPPVTTSTTPHNACAYCQKKGEKLMMCGKCKIVRYCSRDCQVSHFKKGHKNDCKPA